MSEDIGFEEQLRLEALEKEQAAKKRTRVDEDGTVFEWDESKRAWFPKIDSDFIAEYQMSYGIGESTKSNKTDENNQMSAEAYKQYCLDYWKRYYADGDKVESANASQKESSEEMKEEDLQAWANYYNSPEYREWYSKVYGSQGQTEPQSGIDKEDEKIQEIQDERGNGEDPVSEETQNSTEEDKKGKKRKKEPPKWFEMDSEKNTHVYVQNLPDSTTDEEFKELMTKVGLVMYDPITRKPKMKLYRDEDGNLKGDGRCCYIKSESVDLALQILDGYNFKGNIISVERAQFELKGDFNPTKRRKLTKGEKKKAQQQHEKLFAWLPEKNKFIRSNREKVLIIKNAFVQEDFDKIEHLEVLHSRVRQECSRFGGVKKITIFDNNKDGVIKVLFCNAEEVDAAVVYLNGRIFQNRVITAEVWDGRSRYDNKESADSVLKRDEKWSKFLGDEKTEKSGECPESSVKSVSVKDDKNECASTEGKKPQNVISDSIEETSENDSSVPDSSSDSCRTAKATLDSEVVDE